MLEASLNCPKLPQPRPACFPNHHTLWHKTLKDLSNHDEVVRLMAKPSMKNAALLLVFYRGKKGIRQAASKLQQSNSAIMLT